LKNLGMQMPTNLDEFYNMLYAFVHNDPDKNGRMTPLGMWEPWQV
jgi:putative aldouronate transport system substrate-binding protein